jgi:hypothetical protein
MKGGNRVEVRRTRSEGVPFLDRPCEFGAGRVKKKPGSRVDVVVGGKGEGRGTERRRGEWRPGQRWERRDSEGTVTQNQFETPAWQKMDTFARLGNTPFSHSIMVSPRACASASYLITHPQSNDLDSITLGQLKAMVNSAPKPKARTSLCFAYPVLTMIHDAAMLL